MFGGHVAVTIKRIYDKYHMSYDPAKRKLNLRKHAIDLAECEVVCREGETHEQEAYFRAFPKT